MKFDKQALLSLAALCSFTFNADAFIPQARKNSGLALFNARMGPRVTQAMVTRLFSSDDDEDKHELEDPLGKGVDSVSWLPSVVGASGEAISGVKKVSILLISERLIALPTFSELELFEPY